MAKIWLKLVDGTTFERAGLSSQQALTFEDQAKQPSGVAVLTVEEDGKLRDFAFDTSKIEEFAIETP